MTAVYKKELRSFLTSMIGYVFIAFLLVISGIYFTAYQLQAAYPLFSYTLQAIVFVFLIAVPVLTMRVLAEERKQKTDQLLLTAPISIPDIIIGKYLALVTVLLIAVVILCFYPLILLQFGTIPFGETYTTLFGFFLLGSSFLAIGLYISSLTESQVIAAVLTFLVLFVCYVIEGISSFFPETASASFFTMVFLAAVIALLLYVMTQNIPVAIGFGILAEAALTALYLIRPASYEGLIQNLLSIFDLTDHFSEFASGIFDITGIVYYLSVIGIFLFLSVQAIQKRRWS
jgi:ABC-2 type transport system permease protein